MKSTGITRPIDLVGRVVIPKELRDNLGIDFEDKVEFYVEGDRIIIKKFKSGCHCCDNESTTEILGIKLCDECIGKFEEARKIIDKCRGDK